MSNSLEERLKTHSTAFDGLLSLIPAKYYYEEANKNSKKKKKAKKDAGVAKADADTTVCAETSNTSEKSSDKDDSEKPAKNVSDSQKEEDTEPKDIEDPKESVELTESEPAENVADSSDSLIPEEPQLVFDDEGNDANDEETEGFQSGRAKEKKPKLSSEEQKLRLQKRAELKEKLAKKISLLKEKRKAPGTKTGGPIKSREQMLAERKRREELKKQEKLKRKREDVEDEEGSDTSGDEDDEDKDEEEGESEVLFGNIQFADGSRMTSDLKTIRKGVDQKKKKGPANKDLKAHLSKLDAKRRKLDKLSPEERQQHAEKDQWNSLMNQAEGVKVKDDEKLLKKALKRKEKQKLRSEIEWKERKQVVKDTVSARQKRREANLKSRRENKGKKSKNQPKLRKFTGVVKKGKGGKDGKKRAGFEGNVKSNRKQSN